MAKAESKAASEPSQQNGQPPQKKLKLTTRQPSDADEIAVARPETIVASRPKRKSIVPPRYAEAAQATEDLVVTVPQSAKSSDLSSLGSTSPSAKTESLSGDSPPAATRQSYGDFASYYIAEGNAEEQPLKKPKLKAVKPLLSGRAKAKATTSIKKPAAETAKTKTGPKRKSSLPQSPIQSIEVSSRVSSPQGGAPVQDKPLPQTGRVSQPGLAAQVEAAIQRGRHPQQPALTRSIAPGLFPHPPPQQQHMQHLQHVQHQQPPGHAPPPPLPPLTLQQKQALNLLPPPQPPVVEEIPVKFHAAVPQKIKNLEELSTALTTFNGVPPVKRTPSPERPAKTKKVPARVDKLLAMFDDDSDDDSATEPRLRLLGRQDGSLTYGIQFIMNALKSWVQQRKHSAYTSSVIRNEPRPPDIDLKDPWNLEGTSEGKAIAAFRRVVGSGCLVVDAVMDAGLTRALRHLYIQIDVLINQNSKQEPVWKPMSYAPQLAAHKTRIDRFLEHRARAEQEAMRHRAYPHPHMMQNMGIQPPHMHHDQAQPHRRNSGHQQHSQHHQMPPGPPMGFPPGGQRPPHASFGSGNNVPQNSPLPHQSNNGARNAFERVQIYTPGVTAMPRSTGPYKFSFAPPNPTAVQAFGAGAFPTPPPSGLSGRPMPSVPLNAIGANHAAHVQNSRITVPSNAPAVDGAQQMPRPKPIKRSSTRSADGHGHPSNTAQQPSSFTPVNGSRPRSSLPAAAVTVEDQESQRPRKKRKSAMEGQAKASQDKKNTAIGTTTPVKLNSGQQPSTIVLDS